MNQLLAFTSTSSEMIQQYHPPIELDSYGVYGIALYSLNTYNTIPNIQSGINDTMYLVQGETGKVINLQLTEGSYELEQIHTALHNQAAKELAGVNFEIVADYVTHTVKMKCTADGMVDIFFPSNSKLGKLLGFSQASYKGNIWHTSDIPVNISNVNEINVECSLVDGSYRNGEKCHTLYSFYPDVAPTYKIVERPTQLVHLPISNRDEIRHIAIRLVNQHGELVNFRGEEITIQLDLTKFIN